MTRNLMSQSLHDAVVQAVAKSSTGHIAHQNPGREHNYAIQIGAKTLYPDVVLIGINSNKIEFLVEVETSDSVTEAESAQWAWYAKGPGGLCLLVPTESLAAAQAICRRKGISAGFGHWWRQGNEIRFEWQKS